MGGNVSVGDAWLGPRRWLERCKRSTTFNIRRAEANGSFLIWLRPRPGGFYLSKVFLTREDEGVGAVRPVRQLAAREAVEHPGGRHQPVEPLPVDLGAGGGVAVGGGGGGWFVW